MRVRFLYVRYVMNYAFSCVLQALLVLIKKTNLGTKYRPKLVAATMKLLRKGFPSDFVAPSYIRLSFEEYLRVMAPISRAHNDAFKDWVANDFKQFLRAKTKQEQEIVKEVTK